MPKTHYAVLVTATSKTMMIDGKEVEVDLTWADGQTGCIPVFTNKKKAMQLAGDKYPVVSMEAMGE